jgi:hypothetical protein
MKAITRRLRRLEEERFGTAADNEFSLRLRERIEAGRRRLAEARERGPPGSLRDAADTASDNAGDFKLWRSWPHNSACNCPDKFKTH